VPKYAEVIFEPGAHSIMSYRTEDELRSALAEHHRRAVNGEPGAAQDWYPRSDIESDLSMQAEHNSQRPAERVKLVLLYDEHPADISAVGSDGNQLVDAKAVTDLLSGMTSDGKVNMHQLVQALRDEASPVYPVDQGAHASFYKAKEAGTLDLKFLKEVEG
jgi:hypothetical protein